MKNLKKLFAIILVLVLSFVLASCGKEKAEKGYIFNEYLTVSPSNWNQLTYQDNNDTEIMGFIGSNFFSYDYEYDANGEIVPGGFTVNYDAAASLKDVTKDYAGNPKYSVPEGAESGYAYIITLRNDLKWDDGTAIKAEDFVYTMQEQLNPLFKNYRADSFYNSGLVIHNAENYVKQGSYGYANMISADYLDEEYVSFVDGFKEDADGKLYVEVDGVKKDVVFYLNDGGNWGDNGLAAYYNNYGSAVFGDAWETVVAAADEDGKVAMTKEYAIIISDMIAVLHGAPDAATRAGDAGFADYAYTEWEEFCYYGYNFAAVSADDLGIFVGPTEYDIVLVLDKPLYLFKEDGSLSYLAAYQMSDLPLVKKDLYEANKKAPVEGSTLWTSTYNSSKETTASWGPYKLTDFQAGKAFTLEKNEYWYGYGLERNKGKYMTDKIECEIIAEYETALMKFLKGELDSIGITAQVAADYKNSEQAIFSPSDYVGSLQLQSSREALEERQKEGENKTILTYVDFRKALSLAIDRADYNNKCTTASLAGFGLFTSVHYYDVENGGAYRFTDPAKRTLCNIYGIDVDKFDSLDAAYETITGYNLELARQLLTKAYNEAKEAGDISDTDKVVIQFGTGADTTTVRNRFEYIKAAWQKLAETTPLEGRIEMDFKDYGDSWANDFRGGAYDVCMGGWTGAAWDPGYFLLAYLSPDYMYSRAWDTSSTMMTFEMPISPTESVTETMSLIDWYNCLNGIGGAKYDWSSGALAQEYRLELIAALEEQILAVYYTVPISYDFSCGLISYEWDYISRDYNTFMGFGGLRNIQYSYDNPSWVKYVKKLGGEIDYKK